MRPRLALTALLVACAPPPEVVVGGEPSIEIAFPPRNVGQIATDCDGDLQMLIVVDIDGIELQDPYVDGIELVEGQGHWHANLGGLEGYTPSFGQSVEVTADAVQLGVTRLEVTLQDNLHGDIDAELSQNSIEFELVAPDAEACP